MKLAWIAGVFALFSVTAFALEGQEVVNPSMNSENIMVRKAKKSGRKVRRHKKKGKKHGQNGMNQETTQETTPGSGT